MDHMFAALNLSSKDKKPKNEEEGRAPIELLSQFLLAVQDRKMKEALDMAKELLEFEPNNKMIREYVKYINEYIAQGLDEEEEGQLSSESEEEEEEEDDDEGKSSDSESEEEKQETKSSKR